MVDGEWMGRGTRLANGHRAAFLVLDAPLRSGGWDLWRAGPGSAGDNGGSHAGGGHLHAGSDTPRSADADHPDGHRHVYAAHSLRVGTDRIGASRRVCAHPQQRPLYRNSDQFHGQSDARGVSVDGCRLRRRGQPLQHTAARAVLCRPGRLGIHPVSAFDPAGSGDDAAPTAGL